MDAKIKAALENADDFLSEYWFKRGRYGFDTKGGMIAPDPTEVINEIRDLLGRPKIIDLLQAG